MAKLLGPLHSSEARGRLGGLIFNTWRGIATVKSFTSPAQPRTERQLSIRAMHTRLIRGWGILTVSVTDAWNQYAALNPVIDWTGNPKRLTGLNWYTRLNIILLDLAKTILTLPPAGPAPDAVLGLIATGSAGSISCAFTPSTGTAITTDLWAHGPHSAGVQGKLERAKHRLYAPGETSPGVISGLAPGTYTIYARHLSETDGLSSPWVSDIATVS
jgi:hypothetical protein